METPVVEEALRRLSPNELEARFRRLKIGMNLIEQDLIWATKKIACYYIFTILRNCTLLINYCLYLFPITASDLVIKHKELPKDQWTKPEEDVTYLSQYIEEVEQEYNDRAAFRL